MDFFAEMAPLAFFRPFFRGFSSATPKRFEITWRDLLPNLSLDIAEVHEKKISDRMKHDVATRRQSLLVGDFCPL